MSFLNLCINKPAQVICLRNPKTLLSSDLTTMVLLSTCFRDSSLIQNMHKPKLVVVDACVAADSLATYCRSVFQAKKHPCLENEAISLAELFDLTGKFLRFLDDELKKNLTGFRCKYLGFS